MENGSSQAHALLLPYPSQGHIQFAKRLSFHGLLATLATTRFVLSTTCPKPGPVALAPISDGFAEACSTQAYLDSLESVGSKTLDELIRSERAAGRPVRVLIYDSFFRGPRTSESGMGW